MSLKRFTALCLVISMTATIAWGLLFAASPNHDAPRPERRAYAQRIVAATLVALTSLVAAGVGSILILRTTREEYRVASRQNLESLVTGLRSDKGVRDGHDAESAPGDV